MAASRVTLLSQIQIFVICFIGISVNGQLLPVDQCKVDSKDLKMDHARVIIDYSSAEKPNVNLSVDLFTQTEECNECNLQKTTTVINNSTCEIQLDTRWKMRLEIRKIKNTMAEPSCSEKELSRQLQEYGIYRIYVVHRSDKNTLTCLLVLMNDPQDSNIPIYVAIGGLAGLAILWILLKYCYRHRREYLHRILIRTGAESLIDPKPTNQTNLKDDTISAKSFVSPRPGLRNRKNKQQSSAAQTQGMNSYTSQDLGNMQTNINPVDNEDSRPRKERLKSLDTFRGIFMAIDRISLVIMNFVNYGGGGYWFFDHSDWNGLTIADLVFPWFVWIMGTAMAYSFSTQVRNQTPKHWIFWKILKRSMILFGLGLLINSGGCDAVELKTFRIPGVLQRFALTYLITATVHMFFTRTDDIHMHAYWSKFRDVADYWPEWIINFIFLGIHIGITFGMTVPECRKGYIGPGGLDGGGEVDTVNCTGGAAGYIDRKVFGEAHIYHSPTCKEIYKTETPYDPEGLLGTLTSCFMCFLGLQAGKILKTFKEPKGRAIRFLIWGFVLCLIAGILCSFKKDGGWIPINKNLWSISFVICLAGFAFFLLAFCYMTIDVWHIWSGAPFYYPGMNSIFMYIAHIVFQNYFPIGFYVEEKHSLKLALHLWGPTFWCLFTYMMYRKKMFISI